MAFLALFGAGCGAGAPPRLTVNNPLKNKPGNTITVVYRLCPNTHEPPLNEYQPEIKDDRFYEPVSIAPPIAPGASTQLSLTSGCWSLYASDDGPNRENAMVLLDLGDAATWTPFTQNIPKDSP